MREGGGKGGGCTFSLQLVRVSISERVDTLVHANTVIELVLLKVCTLARAQGVLQITKVPRLPGIKGREHGLGVPAGLQDTICNVKGRLEKD